jgi:hypothetical protein
MCGSKATEVVKTDGDFNQSSVKDASWSTINFHFPSSFTGAMVVILIIGLGLGGFALAQWRHRRHMRARRAATSLELKKTSE